MEENFVDISRVTVREISKVVARDFIEKYHYTKKFSSTRYALGIFYKEDTEHVFFTGDNEQLIGCMTYGHPVSNRTVNSIVDDLELDEVLELTRLVCLDGYGKNLESFVIAKSFDWLKKNDSQVKILVSYADPEQAHTGGIYRATNWIYQGCGASKLMPDYSLKLEEDSMWIHSRSVSARFGNKNIHNLAKIIGHTFWRKEETAKHRYIYFLCNKKEKKRILNNLRMPIMSYEDIKETIQLIQKIHVNDGLIEKVEVLQGVDNGWKPQKIELQEKIYEK